MPAPEIEIRRVTVDVILDLRHRILRAGLPPETASFDGDAAPSTIHWAAFPAGMPHISAVASLPPIACATMMLNSWRGEPAWQLRGMAVEKGYQRFGLGRQILLHAEAAATQEDKAGWLWCNARVPAAGFYQAHGWDIASDVFEIPTAGPHVKMTKRLISRIQRESVEKPAIQR